MVMSTALLSSTRRYMYYMYIIFMSLLFCSLPLQFIKVLTLSGHVDWIRDVCVTEDGQ